jgi:hypothetical protein
VQEVSDRKEHVVKNIENQSKVFFAQRVNVNIVQIRLKLFIKPNLKKKMYSREETQKIKNSGSHSANIPINGFI